MILGLKFARVLALPVVLCANLALAQPQSGDLRLKSGASVSWTLADYTVTPALGIALPATISWTESGLDLPIKIDLSTNYAAYIEQWEMSLYRESDTRRRHPIRQWRRPAAAFDAGVIWNGEVEAGPPLRPGETIVALLRVRDVAGNIDEAKPQSMLVSRYLMPAQKRDYDRISRARRASVAAGDAPEIQTIPVQGRLLDVWGQAKPGSSQLYLSGLAMDDVGNGAWQLAQILPNGSYSLKVQTERPIFNGVRLVSEGEIAIDVPSSEDLFATVKGTGNLPRKPLSQRIAGMKADGEISGNDAVRMTLWSKGDPKGRFALAIADPETPVGLYRDDRNRSVAKFRAVPRTIPWGGKQEPRESSEPIKMRAQYPVGENTVLVLPHTDIVSQRFFVSLRADAAPTYLKEGVHYQLERMQGHNGSSQARVYGNVLPQSSGTSRENSGVSAGQEPGWFERIFGGLW